MLPDCVQQRAEDGIAETATLMLGQDSYVDDVKVPAAIAEDATHSHGTATLVMQDVYRRPTAPHRRSRLVAASRRQTGAQTQSHIVSHRGWPLNQSVTGRH